MTQQNPAPSSKEIFSTAKVVIFGWGYVAGFLTQALTQHGVAVYIVTRNPEKHAAITAAGATPVSFGDPLPENATHLLATAPPQDVNTTPHDPVLAAYPRQGLTAPWVGYLSTTGVYGHTEGKVVDVTSPPNPASGRTRARVVAEKAWQPAHVFRLAGIYGPGRHMLLRLKKDPTSPILQNPYPTGRIHVADIVAVLMASMAQDIGQPPQTYNLADDAPAPTKEVAAYGAKLLGLPVPEDAPYPQNGPMGDGWRVVDNSKIKQRLGVVLQYPTYKEGLAALSTDS